METTSTKPERNSAHGAGPSEAPPLQGPPAQERTPLDPWTQGVIGLSSELDIVPRRGWQPIDLKELWRYRGLLWFLALRDIKVRYKQTVLGATWAVLQPFLTMVVFTIFIGYFGHMSSASPVPYPLLTFAALLPWQLFANAMTNAGNSLVQNQNLVTKVYFPRLCMPIAAVLVGLVDFLIAFVVLIAMVAFYYFFMHQPIAWSWAMLTLPLFVLLALAASLAIGLWLSALNVEYRDVRYVIPFLTQIWMFASPVVYVLKIVPPKWQPLCALNPMTGVVEGFRWAILGSQAGQKPGPVLWVSVAMTIVMLIGGMLYFRRMEDSFADVV